MPEQRLPDDDDEPVEDLPGKLDDDDENEPADVPSLMLRLLRELAAVPEAAFSLAAMPPFIAC